MLFFYYLCAVVRYLIKVLSWLPLWLMYGLSTVSAAMLYHVVRYRRHVVRRNLRNAFPEESALWLRRTERRFYRFFTDMIFETAKLASISPRTIKRHMHFANIEAVEKELNNGHSVALFLGHMGNWEWSSSMPLHLPTGVIAAQVYRRLKSHTFDRLMLENRQRMGAVCVEMRDVARRLSQWRERVSIVGYIADQATWTDQHHVRFLNHTVPVRVGAEKVVRKYGQQAWFLDVRRVRRGHYEGTFVRLEPKNETSPYPITDIYYEHLERAIRHQPEIYLWTHNRFKNATGN